MVQSLLVLRELESLTFATSKGYERTRYSFLCDRDCESRVSFYVWDEALVEYIRHNLRNTPDRRLIVRLRMALNLYERGIVEVIDDPEDPVVPIGVCVDVDNLYGDEELDVQAQALYDIAVERGWCTGEPGSDWCWRIEPLAEWSEDEQELAANKAKTNPYPPEIWAKIKAESAAYGKNSKIRALQGSDGIIAP